MTISCLYLSYTVKQTVTIIISSGLNLRQTISTSNTHYMEYEIYLETSKKNLGFVYVSLMYNPHFLECIEYFTGLTYQWSVITNLNHEKVDKLTNSFKQIITGIFNKV